MSACSPESVQGISPLLCVAQHHFPSSNLTLEIDHAVWWSAWIQSCWVKTKSCLTDQDCALLTAPYCWRKAGRSGKDCKVIHIQRALHIFRHTCRQSINGQGKQGTTRNTTLGNSFKLRIQFRSYGSNPHSHRSVMKEIPNELWKGTCHSYIHKCPQDVVIPWCLLNIKENCHHMHFSGKCHLDKSVQTYQNICRATEFPKPILVRM